MLETADNTTALSAPEPDWNAIQERYLEGESSGDLAAEFGTTANAIRLRASKHKWKEKQLRRLQENEIELGKEVRGCLLVSVVREARHFRLIDLPSNPIELDLLSKVRARLVDTAGKLLGWERDPVMDAKPARCLEV